MSNLVRQDVLLLGLEAHVLIDILRLFRDRVFRQHLKSPQSMHRLLKLQRLMRLRLRPNYRQSINRWPL